MIQTTPVHNKPVNLNLNGLNSSEQFFQEGKDKLEQEIKWLQRDKTPVENILQVDLADLENSRFIAQQETIEGWCIDSEGNITLTDQQPPDSLTQEGIIILSACP